MSGGAARAYGAASQPPPSGYPPRRPAPPPRTKSAVADGPSRTPSTGADSADEESTGGGGVKVTKITNIDSRYQPRLRKLILSLFGKCAKQSGFKGKLIVRLYSDGTIGTEGGNVALRACLLQHRVIDQLMNALREQQLVDPNKPAIIEVTFQ